MIRFKVKNETVLMNVQHENISMSIQNKTVSMSIQNKKVSMTIQPAVCVGTHGQVYDGSYTIIPKVEEQRIETKNKYMMDDVTINSVPFFSVSNSSGGDTVYIASEVSMNGIE